MNVATILKDKGSEVETAATETLLRDIARTLDQRRIGCIVIVDDDGMVKGIVSERDVVRLISREGAPSLDQPVSKCMTTEVITCERADTIEKLMSEMTAHRFRHLPVVEEGKLVGIVSIGDVVKLRIAEAEMEAAAMREYIATG